MSEQQAKHSFWSQFERDSAWSNEKRAHEGQGNETIAIDDEAGSLEIYPTDEESEATGGGDIEEGIRETFECPEVKEMAAQLKDVVDQAEKVVSATKQGIPISVASMPSKSNAKPPGRGILTFGPSKRGQDMSPGADEPARPRLSGTFERPGAYTIEGLDLSAHSQEEERTFQEEETTTESTETPSIPPVSAHLVDEDEEQRMLRELQEENLRYREREENAVIAQIMDMGLWSYLDIRDPTNRRKQVVGYGVLFLVLAIIVVAIVLGVVLPEREVLVTEAPTPAPTPEPTSVEQGWLSDFLATVSFDGGEALKKQSTPQYRAVKWLSQDWNVENYTEKMMIQRYTLATFYYSMHGDNWTNNSLWLDYEKECGRWFQSLDDSRLSCTSNGDVDRLVLDDNNLKGTVPPELGLLSDSLAEISLWMNAFWPLTGTIPTELGVLTKLTRLDFDDNMLNGTIPTVLGLLTKLEYLGTAFNKLSGTIPTELGQLTGLESLHINYNPMEGTIPSSIGLMISLKRLWLDDCGLMGSVPSEIWHLLKLDKLSLSMNSVTGTLPTDVGLMVELEDLWLNDNKFIGTIPSEIGQLTNLENVGIWSNAFNGTLPTTIGRLTRLERLWLFENELEGSIPSEIGQLTNLMSIELQENEINGTIPVTISTMTSLTSVSLGNGLLSGTIPTMIGLLTKLGALKLYGNKLTGTIPNEIGELTALTALSLRNNHLTGTIPSVIQNMTALETLNLYDNNLTGPFACPDFIENCRISCNSSDDEACRVLA